ncbi:hypothetical protein CW745_13420 [Psychromonas sp. psych-6C06]|uniref:hypothetical protein n=1 Tax=Psychromonas sp. psych-6C06 TaxID=2058089 RepID=UPI000C34E22B|nr:hypothetical protein [Psychromonas sp. psych-6C06]PKF60869.1 hypothetical protein CW745_13420 [Psychromonas sp. psych-6C06]
MFKKLSIATVLLASSSVSQALPVEISYSGAFNSGTFSECSGYDLAGFCMDWTDSAIQDSAFYGVLDFAVGDTFSGTIGYDSSVVAGNDDGAFASWDQIPLASTLTIAGDEATTTAGLPNFEYSSAFANNMDGFDGFSLSQSGFIDDWWVSIGLDIFDYDGILLSDTTLPEDVAFPENGASTFNIVFMKSLSDDIYRFTGDLDSLVSVNVPAPASLGFFSIALIGFSLYRKKRA